MQYVYIPSTDRPHAHAFECSKAAKSVSRAHLRPRVSPFSPLVFHGKDAAVSKIVALVYLLAQT
jgi:hypothetical protein